MPDRLSALDASYLYLEDGATVMHVGSVMVLEAPPEGFDVEDLARSVEARIAYIPRYRQRVRSVPGHLANPVWVDDERFDLAHHVRRTALPRPGSRAQLTELVARVQPRRLDRTRPLWEVYLVEGLEDGGLAIITKTHQAMVDGEAAVDLGQVLWDDAPSAAAPPGTTWRPSREPSLVELVTGAVVDAVRRPPQVLDTLRSGAGDVRATLRRAAGTATGLARAASSATGPQGSPLDVVVGEQRRFAVVDTDLEDYRAVRRALDDGPRRRRPAAQPRAAGEPAQLWPRTDLHDVVLAVLTGALRAWMLARGLGVGPSTVVRTLVPLSVEAPEEEPGLGSVLPATHVVGHLVDLPVGEPDPVVRLQQVSFAMRRGSGGRRVSARELAGVAGFAPPTLHSLGVRVAGSLSHRVFNLVVTDVPGPQHPLYVGPVRLRAAYPVIPLAAGQGLAVGVNSYDGAVTFGLNADRDGVPDLDVLAGCVADALAELVEVTGAVPGARSR
ncbi:wax ester/triacylglycerol synthase domain-containing protein [uncultured Pseudokineococcus sp.]|uniref:wax ester/triacylglycerol synthase domain-containing protein n=1 Tax=uncultured Pseudokineococcus sp. TaxID=1642928 RepID=UPI00260525E2|nr:wax ester/triacylglycerol synthase domain-containing protein [uncultured Pseudokineococcus sp.]